MLVPFIEDLGPTNTAPFVVGAIANQTGVIGTAITPFDVSAYLGNATSYSIPGGELPPGLSLAGSVISGTPSTAGAYAAIVVTGSNAYGSISLPPFTWTVGSLAIPISLVANILDVGFVQRQAGAPLLLTDLWHQWGGDIQLSNVQDFLGAQGVVRGQQRILRRLLTNPGDYIFHANARTGDTYGAGLRRYIGQPADLAKLRALIGSQVLLEDSVGKTPPPVVSVSPASTPNNAMGALAVSITYTDAPSAAPTVLSFTVSA